MNKKLFLSAVVICLLISSALYSQVTTPTNNTILPPQYVGWSGLTPTVKHLDIKNNFAARDINFFINTSGINGSSTQAMVIKNTTGFVGIGPGFTTPASMLHVHDGITSSFQMSNAGTTAAAGRGFRVFQLGAQISIGQQEQSEMFFNTGGAIAAATERMVIMGTPGATQGFIGMGTNFVNPQSLLHVSAFNNGTGKVFRTDGNETLTNEWELFTGPNAAGSILRGRIFAPFNPPLEDFNMEATLGSIRLFASGGFGTMNNILERMVITNGDFLNAASVVITPNVTRVGISYGGGAAPIVTPQALLHLGFDAAPGHRNWMDIGTYMAKGDNMYVGLKDEANNRQDAVINWGDDGVAAGPDNLRFIFTGVSGPGPASLFDGFETGRVTPFGFWGIGNFFNDPLFPFGNPVRRMEILSDKPVAAANGNAQLRLTNFQQDPANIANTGRYAELHDIQTGDLVITSSDNTLATTPTQNFKERFVGINTSTPGNTAEINSQYALSTTLNGQPVAPGFGPPTGWAGLRFTDLKSTSIPQFNSGTGVLSVDSNGDVILVPANSGTGIGNYCFATPNPLIAVDYEVPLNTFNYRFTGQSIPFDPTALLQNKDVVGIGYGCGTIIPAKFSVLQQVGPTPVNTTAATFINRDSDFSNLSLTFRGIVAISDFPQPGGAARNIGGEFRGANAPISIGVRSQASSSLPSGINYAGYFFATTASAAANIGIFAQAGASSGGNFAGAFVGDVDVNGTLFTTTGTVSVSDSLYKTNIDTLQNALSLVNMLKPKTFYFDTLNTAGFNLPSQKQYGLIAQQVETILPELVISTIKPAEYDTSGVVIHPAVAYKSLNYNAFIAILMKGIQEQNQSIDSLKEENNLQDSINNSLQTQINQLGDLINSCCTSHSMLQNNSNNSIVSQDVELKDGQSIVLDQNTPNPFAEQTTINYFLPDNVVKAQMLFYNVQGKLIQSVDLNQKGKGSLNVFAQDLSNGIYTYTLVVDGKVFETKKMIKQ